MKKFALLAAIAALGTIMVGPTAVLAADGGQYQSDGSIEFVPSKKPTKPVDPIDPTKPGKPINPEDPSKKNKPGTQGPLSIDYASSFYFGKQEITTENKIYDAAAQKYLDAAGDEKVGPNYVQVSDNRGSEAGWKLVVKQDAQFVSKNKHTLDGAEVTFEHGHVVTNAKSKAPAGTANMVMTPGADQRVMNARAGEGAGTYLLDWGKDGNDGAHSVHLAVPGSTTKYAERYATTFTWTLSDTPDNN